MDLRDSGNYTITVNSTLPPTITSNRVLPGARFDRSYVLAPNNGHALQATGGYPFLPNSKYPTGYFWQQLPKRDNPFHRLPAGMTLNSNGVISGTPVWPKPPVPLTPQTYTIEVRATDLLGKSSSANFTLVVEPPEGPEIITECPLPSGLEMERYPVVELRARKGKLSYRWPRPANLPPGLVWNEKGYISGTPTMRGNYTIDLRVVDANGLSANKTCLIVIRPAPEIDCPPISCARVGDTLLPVQLRARGGDLPYGYSAVNLPPSLSINQTTGLISGNFTGPGNMTYNATYTVRDAANRTANITCPIVVKERLEITTASPLPFGIRGLPYPGKTGVPVVSINATGGWPPYTYQRVLGLLPDGLSINPNTGVISGTPTKTGTFKFTIRVKDSCETPAGWVDKEFEITIYDPITIFPQPDPCLMVSRTFSLNMTVSGGAEAFVWSDLRSNPAVANLPPSPVPVSARVARITGTPTTAGPLSFTFNVTSTPLGVTETITINYTIHPELKITTECPLVDGTLDVPYSVDLTAVGGKSPLIWSLVPPNNTLPPGLTLNSTTGKISGTPKTPGNFTFTFQVSDSCSQNVTKNCTIRIIDPCADLAPLSFSTSNPLQPWYVGESNELQFQVAGGRAPYTFVMDNSTLPPGVSSNSQGRIFGTPTQVASSLGTPEVHWVQWNGPPVYSFSYKPPYATAGIYAKSTTGKIQVPGLGEVNVILDGEIMNKSQFQTTDGGATWNTTYVGGLNGSPIPSTYKSIYVPTLPTNSDRISIIGSEVPRQRIQFSKEVSNIVMNIRSLGSGGPTGDPAEYRFENEFTITGNDVSPFLLTKNGRSVIGKEGNGQLIFPGKFSNITWTMPDPEAWNDWNIGVTSAFPNKFKVKVMDACGRSIEVEFTLEVRRRDDAAKTITPETEINIWFDDSGSMSDVLPNLEIMRDEVLKPCLLPFYGGNATVYAQRVRVRNYSDASNFERTFQVLGTNGTSPGVTQVINIAFQDEANDGYHPRSGWTDEDVDIAWLRDRLQATGPDFISGAALRVEGDDDFLDLLRSVMVSGIAPYDGANNLLPYTQNGTAQLALYENIKRPGYYLGSNNTEDGSPLYYANKVVEAINDIGYDLELCGGYHNPPISITPVILTQSPAEGATIGVPYTAILTAVGGTRPYTWSLPSGALPPGLNLDSNSGIISGIPLYTISSNFSVKVVDDNNQSDEKPFSLEVKWPLLGVEWSEETPTISLGEAAPEETFTASGGDGEYTWSISSGSLPPGIFLSDNFGETVFLSGTPTAPGTYNFRVSVNSAGQEMNIDVTYIVEPGPAPTPEMVFVEGGTLPQSSELDGAVVENFLIGKYEVTWEEWQELRAWAVANGYTDLSGVGNGTAGNHPVQQVSWYDVLKWSNARSEREGFTPVYSVNGTVYRTGQSVPTVNSSANGYRLPTEVEWEWAARGGVSSQGYTYSGSNDVNVVAWYSGNSNGGTKAVGTKGANELAIYDMSGNVFEWCWDVFDPNPSNRRMRGGGWGNVADRCPVAYRGSYGNPDFRNNSNLGFRLARSSGN